MLKLNDCLSQEETKKVLDLIHSLKPYWEERAGKGIPFYTLGTAAYMDAAEHGAIYYKKKAERTNPLLREHFSFLYESLLATLEKFTAKKVVFEKELALPGFHIFQYYELFKKPIASPHYDLQFDRFEWNYKNVDYDHPLSFTLALKLPTGGGGLNYWDLYYNDYKKLNRMEMAEIAEKNTMHYLPYEIGKIAIHEGFMLHRIAPAKDMQAGDERITLQGHGLICDDVLHVYW
jgi:hypothetical protein